MREPYWHDETATLYAGGAREVLAEMPDGSADCIVTSPPPWTPPDTSDPDPDSGGAGHGPTPALYIAALRRVFAEAHRILIDHGTAWLALGDLYASQHQLPASPAGRHTRGVGSNLDQAMTGLPAASLIGLPWQLAFALRDDGWIIRNAIIWSRPTVEAEPATDRFACSYELIFLLAKNERHHFDPDATLRPLDRLVTEFGLVGDRHAGWWRQDRDNGRQTGRRGTGGNAASAAGNCRSRSGERHDTGKHVRGTAGDVWSLPARPLRDVLPLAVPLRCIATGCRPGGTVLDPFARLAATGLAARALGRSFIGIEETASLCRNAERRLRRDTGTET